MTKCFSEDIVCKEKEVTLEDRLFLYGLIAVPIAVVLYVMYRWIIGRYNLYFFEECQLLRIFGIYCPGCGGTRAFRYLLQGKILTSIYWHPAICYGAFLYIIFMLSHIVEIVSKRKLQGLKWHNIYIYIAVFLIAINFIVKNIA